MLVACLLPACAGKTEADADARFEENKSLFAEVARADQFALYEGLPHPMNEAELFEREKGKPTRTLHGELFYPEPLTVSKEDAEKLHGLLGSEDSFRPWSGEKKCGGFHSDYAAEWRYGTTYQVLICFGCGEVQVFGTAKSLRCDVQNGAKEHLKTVLGRYRKNRPEKREE
jgi:hypothetical protein